MANFVNGWQRTAALALGWDIESWDVEMLVRLRPADDHPAGGMFKKGEKVLAFDSTGAVCMMRDPPSYPSRATLLACDDCFTRRAVIGSACVFRAALS